MHTFIYQRKELLINFSVKIYFYSYCHFKQVSLQITRTAFQGAPEMCEIQTCINSSTNNIINGPNNDRIFPPKKGRGGRKLAAQKNKSINMC